MKLFESIKKKTKYSILLLKPQYKVKFQFIFIFILFGVFLEVVSLTSVLPLVSALSDDNNFIYEYIKNNYKYFNLFQESSVNLIYLVSILFFVSLN
jgi:hypothetical protein